MTNNFTNSEIRTKASLCTGYPAGFLTDRLDRNAALKAAGNSVVTIQARAAWEMLEINP